jgi:hypothetical protein
LRAKTQKKKKKKKKNALKRKKIIVVFEQRQVIAGLKLLLKVHSNTNMGK